MIVLGKGRNATRVSASGKVVLTAERAKRESKNGPVILCRALTDPADLEGMVAADGILTARGGALSHAAIVSIELGKACIVSAGFEWTSEGIRFPDGGIAREGDTIYLDGNTGTVSLA